MPCDWTLLWVETKPAAAVPEEATPVRRSTPRLLAVAVEVGQEDVHAGSEGVGAARGDAVLVAGLPDIAARSRAFFEPALWKSK